MIIFSNRLLINFSLESPRLTPTLSTAQWPKGAQRGQATEPLYV